MIRLTLSKREAQITFAALDQWVYEMESGALGYQQEEEDVRRAKNLLRRLHSQGANNS